MVQICAGMDLVPFSKNACYSYNQFPKKLLKKQLYRALLLATAFFFPRSQLFVGSWLFLVGLCLGAPTESPALAQATSLSKVTQYRGTGKLLYIIS